MSCPFAQEGCSVKCVHENSFHVDEALWGLCQRIKHREATGVKVYRHHLFKANLINKCCIVLRGSLLITIIDYDLFKSIYFLIKRPFSDTTICLLKFITDLLFNNIPNKHAHLPYPFHLHSPLAHVTFFFM